MKLGFLRKEDGVILGVRGLWLKCLTFWVGKVSRLALFTVLVAFLVTGGSLFYTIENLKISTSTTGMLSDELRFQQVYQELKDAFPVLRGNITIVVDGATPDLAEDKARELVAALRKEEGVFSSVYDFADDPYFRRNGLLYLDEDELSDLSERLADAQPLLATLSQDMSLRGLFAVLTDALDGIDDDETGLKNLADFFGHFSTALEAQERGDFLPMSWRRIMMGGEVEKSDLRHFILARPNLNEAALQPANEGISTIRNVVKALDLNEENGVRVRLTGAAVINQEELVSVSTGAGLAGFLSLILVSVLVVVGLKSLRLVASTLITLVMGLIWTAGYATLAVGQLNLISVAFAVLFIGIGVDFGIQFCLRYQEEIRRGLANDEALRQTVMGVGGALSLAALCAAIGFFAFVPTAYVGLSELGIISGGSMFIALFANLTVLPALIYLMPPRVQPRSEDKDGQVRGVSKLAAQTSKWLCRYYFQISVSALVVGIVMAVIVLPRLYFDFDPMNLKDPSTESVETALELMADSETSFYTIKVMSPSLEEAERISRDLEALPEVDSARTFADFLPSDQENKLYIIDDMVLFLLPVFDQEEAAPLDDAQRLAGLSVWREKLKAFINTGKAGGLTQEALRLSRNLARYETAHEGAGAAAGDDNAGPNSSLMVMEEILISSLPARLSALESSLEAKEVTYNDLPDTLRERYIASDGQALIEVFPVENLSDNEALRRFVEAVRRVAPDATDSPVMLLEGGNAVTTAFKQAGTLSLSIIFVLLVIVLRGVVDALLVLMPLALAAVLTAAASVFLHIPFNFANIIAIPLLFSLGVAYGLYFVLRERETASVTDDMATNTPRSILFSALTTMASFGTLLVSSHRGTASMGQLLSISLALALICTLVVLPALLEMRRRYSARNS